jgi:hypothetical protein
VFKRNFSIFAALFLSGPVVAKQTPTQSTEPLDLEARFARAQEIIEKLDQPVDYGGVTRDKADPNKLSWWNFQNFNNNFRNFQNFNNNFRNFQNFQNFHNFQNVQKTFQNFQNFHNAPTGRQNSPPADNRTIQESAPPARPNPSNSTPVVHPRPLAQPPAAPPSMIVHRKATGGGLSSPAAIRPEPSPPPMAHPPPRPLPPPGAPPTAGLTPPNSTGPIPHPPPRPLPPPGTSPPGGFTPPNSIGQVPHPAPQPMPSLGAPPATGGVTPPNSQAGSSNGNQPAPGAITVGQYQVGGKTYQYAFCSSQGACEYWNSATDGVMTINGQIVGGQGQSAASAINSNAPPAETAEQINQTIGQLSRGLINSMMQAQTESPPQVPVPPTMGASPDNDGADAVPEVPPDAQPPNMSDGQASQSNYGNSTLEQLEQSVSNSAADAINEYQQSSEQIIDDINGAIDMYDQVDTIREAAEAYRDGEFDSYVLKNVAAATYQGIVGDAIDAVAPKSGDPLRDSMNDFLHTAARLFPTEPTLSGVFDRFKIIFQDMTGNAKANLDCLKSMVANLETDNCANK